MSDFKFKRTKKNKFRWENKDLYLEFSNPSIQGHEEFVELKDTEDILYYYYNVKIFKKTLYSDEDDNTTTKRKLITKRRTHDFPSIINLLDIIELQMNDDTSKNGQKLTYSDGEEKGFIKAFSTPNGFWCDDVYEISKFVSTTGKFQNYSLYCGTTLDYREHGNTCGIQIPYVTQGDLEELLKCVKSFIDYSIELNNQVLKEYGHVYKVKDCKLYEYEGTAMEEKGVIDSIYTEKDVLNIIYLNNEGKQQETGEMNILKILDNKIILNNARKTDIPVDSVRFVMLERSEEVYSYNKSQIADDFILILSGDEKEEFKTQSLKYLKRKYKDAIRDRTAMCREEHNFKDRKNTGIPVNDVLPVIKKVVKIIKERV